MNKEIHTAIVEKQKILIDSGNWCTCINCDSWNENKCQLYDITPPANVIVNGCEHWQFDIPF